MLNSSKLNQGKALHTFALSLVHLVLEHIQIVDAHFGTQHKHSMAE
jgi:uncharacterized membrane protein